MSKEVKTVQAGGVKKETIISKSQNKKFKAYIKKKKATVPNYSEAQFLRDAIQRVCK